MNKALAIALALAFVSILMSCSGSQIVRVRPFSTDLYVWPQLYQQNLEKLNTFVGKARLTIESEQYSGNVTLSTTWIDEENLHLQAEGPLGVDVGKIFIGKDRFIIYNQYNNFFTSGSLEDPYLNRFMQTNITLKELRKAVVGQAIQWRDLPVLSDTLHGIFTAEHNELIYRYLVNPGSGFLERVEISHGDRVFLIQDLKNYRIINGIYIPMLTQITLPEQRERISVFYSDVQINSAVNPEPFRIDVSPKVEQLNLN